MESYSWKRCCCCCSRSQSASVFHDMSSFRTTTGPNIYADNPAAVIHSSARSPACHQFPSSSKKQSTATLTSKPVLRVFFSSRPRHNASVVNQTLGYCPWKKQEGSYGNLFVHMCNIVYACMFL